MTCWILNRIDFAVRYLDPHIGIVTKFGDPMPNPGSFCQLECLVILRSPNRILKPSAESFARYPCLEVLGLIVPSGFDHAAVGDRATQMCIRDSVGTVAAR